MGIQREGAQEPGRCMLQRGRAKTNFACIYISPAPEKFFKTSILSSLLVGSRVMVVVTLLMMAIWTLFSIKITTESSGPL